MTDAQETYVFDIAQARRGLAVNRLCASLRTVENRAAFLADESAYADLFGLSAAQKRAIVERDWTAMLELGGSIFYTFKLAQVDRRSMQYLGGVFTKMTEDEFRAAMRSGGRSFG